MEEPAQDVPPQAVGAQDEARAGRGVDRVGVLGGERIGRQQRAAAATSMSARCRGRENRDAIPPEPPELAGAEEVSHHRYRIRGSTAA